MSNLVLAIPGTGWTCREPLCQACLELYRSRGWDTAEIDFSSIPFRAIPTIPEAVEAANRVLMSQLAPLGPLSARDEVVLLSKSLGTLCAGWLEQKLSRPVRQVYLTPIEETLAYITPSSHVTLVVAGAEDPLMDPERLCVFCGARNIPCLVIEGVGHSLSTSDEAQDRSIRAAVTALLLEKETFL